MATDQRTLVISGADDAAQRTYVAGLVSALTAGGLVRTADTGQFDTVNTARSISGSSPGVQDLYQGYLMFRLADALQATKPVFIKINLYLTWHYNSYFGNGMPGAPSLYIQVGTATNGAGTFIGTTTNNLRCFGTSNPQAVSNSGASGFGGNAYNFATTWTCGDTSSIQTIFGAQNTQQMYYTMQNGPLNDYGPFPALLWIERTRNPDGTPNGNGVMVAACGWPGSANNPPTTSEPKFQVLSFLNSGQVSAYDTSWPITWPGGNAFSIASQGAEMSLFPAQLASPKAEYSLGFMGFYKNDMSLGAQVSVSHLGVAHNFISLAGLTGNGNGLNDRSYVNTFVNSGALLMRWE